MYSVAKKSRTVFHAFPCSNAVHGVASYAAPLPSKRYVNENGNERSFVNFKKLTVDNTATIQFYKSNGFISLVNTARLQMFTNIDNIDNRTSLHTIRNTIP